MGANGMVESYKSLDTVLYCRGKYYLHSFMNAVKGAEGEGNLARKGKEGTPLLRGSRILPMKLEILPGRGREAGEVEGKKRRGQENSSAFVIANREDDGPRTFRV